MLLPAHLPLEVAFGGVAIWSGLIGLFLLGVDAITGSRRMYPVAGFFYVLARTGFGALLTVLVWRQLAVLQSADDWRAVALPLLLVLIFGFMILANAVVLAERVFTDRYGAERAAPSS
jgi:hypothetical protein